MTRSRTGRNPAAFRANPASASFGACARVRRRSRPRRVRRRRKPAPRPVGRSPCTPAPSRRGRFAQQVGRREGGVEYLEVSDPREAPSIRNGKPAQAEPTMFVDLVGSFRHHPAPGVVVTVVACFVRPSRGRVVRNWSRVPPGSRLGSRMRGGAPTVAASGGGAPMVAAALVRGSKRSRAEKKAGSTTPRPAESDSTAAAMIRARRTSTRVLVLPLGTSRATTSAGRTGSREPGPSLACP